MQLLVQKNFLCFGKYKFPCAIGKNGITKNKMEGDGCSPSGRYKINEIYYRADRLGKIKFKTDSFEISPDDGWCDDPNSQFYNKRIKFPFSYSAENLHRQDNLYDIVCVINYNMNPTKPGKGSAIFLHVAHHDYKGTEGCVAIKLDDLLKLAPLITNDTLINIES